MGELLKEMLCPEIYLLLCQDALNAHYREKHNFEILNVPIQGIMPSSRSRRVSSTLE